MRTVKAKTPKKTKPVYLVNSNVDGDCFGKEWIATSRECLKCGEFDICMTIQHQNIIENKELEDERKCITYVDAWDFSLVDWVLLEKNIKDNPHTFKIKDVESVVSLLSECDDKKTVSIKVQNFLLEKGIKTDKELCLYL